MGGKLGMVQDSPRARRWRGAAAVAGAGQAQFLIRLSLSEMFTNSAKVVYQLQCPCICLYVPFPCNLFQTSYWSSDHMIISRPLIGQPSFHPSSPPPLKNLFFKVTNVTIEHKYLIKRQNLQTKALLLPEEERKPSAHSRSQKLAHGAGRTFQLL